MTSTAPQTAPANASTPAPTARDQLALVRTELANERTLLAYLRTGLALVVGALTMRQLLDDPVLRSAGVALGILGVLALGVGVHRYRNVQSRVRASLPE